MPSEVPIFSQGKYETGYMPSSRCNELSVLRKTLKSWNPWRTKIPKHQCGESRATGSLDFFLQYWALLDFGLEEDDFFVL